MFRFFVITFEILALVVILRTPFVQFWFSDIQTSVANWMLEVSMTMEKSQLDDFRTEIAPHIQNLKGYQKDYLFQVTENKSTLRSFHLHYCQGNDKNPYIYGASLRYVCGEINRQRILEGFG